MDGSKRKYMEHGEPNNKELKSTQSAFVPSIVLGQCFGLMPVLGVRGTLFFHRRSFRFVYSVVCTVLVFFQVAFHAATILTLENLQLFNFVEFLFHSNSFLTYCYFINLAQKWPRLMKVWCEVDRSMESKYPFPWHLRRKLNFLTVLMIGSGILEHGLYIMFKALTMKLPDDDPLNTYWRNIYAHYFRFLPYHPVLAIIANFIIIISTFSWSYTDLFIMLVSTALVERFVQVKDMIYTYVERREADNEVWRELREDYDKLSQLSKLLDSAMGDLVVLSYSINLFIILIQLLHSLESEEEFKLISLVYFIYSFGVLIIRLVAVSLLAARVHTESTAPADCLNELPSEIYNEEASRLLVQIKMDPSYFSGREFFRIKKSLILGITGAIVSYELIFIQFTVHKGNGTQIY